jgi:transketolase
MELSELEELKKRAKILKKAVIELTLAKGEAHLGGSFSEIEILISLYDKILKEEDKFLLSKGHCAYPMYILLRERGYDPKISAHPDIDESNKIYCTTGSLGHGLPIGIGMALARKKKNKPGRIYVLMGDGECQEGTTWESFLIAAHHKLNNLIVIIDRNKLQALDKIENVLSLGDLAEKFRTFGWYVSEVNGHNFSELIEALKINIIEKPHVIIANTIKGNGVSYMENDPKWHTRLPTPEELKIAYEELK